MCVRRRGFASAKRPLNSAGEVGRLFFAGTYTSASFTVAGDGHGGTEVLATGHG